MGLREADTASPSFYWRRAFIRVAPGRPELRRVFLERHSFGTHIKMRFLVAFVIIIKTEFEPQIESSLRLNPTSNS